MHMKIMPIKIFIIDCKLGVVFFGRNFAQVLAFYKYENSG